MPLLQLRRHLEAGHGAALRIHRGEDLPDRPVFPRGVATLQHDQKRVSPISVEDALLFRYALDVLFGGALQLLSGLKRAAHFRMRVVEVYRILRANGLELQCR